MLAASGFVAPASAKAPTGPVTVTGTPGRVASIDLPRDGDSDLFLALFRARDRGGLVGPSLGDWTGAVLEDAEGTVQQAAACVRVAPSGLLDVVCMSLGLPDEPPTGPARLRLVGNGTTTVSLTLSAGAKGPGTTVRARAASPRGRLSFTQQGMAGAWDERVDVPASSLLLVAVGQRSADSPSVFAQQTSMCVSQTTGACPVVPLTPYADVQTSGARAVINGLLYRPGDLAPGAHGWTGASVGTVPGRFRFSVVLPV